MVSLPRCLSEALYSLQLRMRYVAFFFIARKAYHVTASATLHSDSCNKALSHIRKVAVGFIISGKNLTPQEITNALGLQPDHSAACGDERRNLEGALLAPHDNGFWRLDTDDKVKSKDINDHFRYLLSILLPHRDAILKLSKEEDIYLIYYGNQPIFTREQDQ